MFTDPPVVMPPAGTATRVVLEGIRTQDGDLGAVAHGQTQRGGGHFRFGDG